MEVPENNRTYMVYHGKSHLSMDDLGGTPILKETSIYLSDYKQRTELYIYITVVTHQLGSNSCENQKWRISHNQNVIKRHTPVVN
jgi:hypothetical protein